MASLSPIPHRHPIRVVLSSTALLPFMSVRKAAALSIAQLGIAAFFISSVTRDALGDAAPWFVLAATIFAAFVRAIDIESWALLIPGGFVSRVASAFGDRAAGLAKAMALAERIRLGGLACVVIGHYVASVSATAIVGWRFTGYVRSEELATLIAIGVLGVLWLPTRIGRDISRDVMARAIWISVAVLVTTIVWGVISLARSEITVSSVAVAPSFPSITGWSPLDALLAVVVGFALTLPVIGGGEVLARAAHELPPPRVQSLRRTSLLTVLFAGIATTVGTFLIVLLVPASEQPLWANAPLAGLAQHLVAPSAVRVLMAVALGGAAVLILGPAAVAAVSDAEQMLHRFSSDGTLPAGLASLHTRFGTPARAVDITVVAMAVAVLASGGCVAWLSRAYTIAIVGMLVMTVAVLVRVRHTRRAPMPFKARGNIGCKCLPGRLSCRTSVTMTSASVSVRAIGLNVFCTSSV